MREGQKTRFSLGEWVRARLNWLISPIIQAFARWGVSPNLVTFVGFLFNIPVAVALSAQRLTLAGGLLLLATSLDALDGALARYSGQTTTFGAFWDSVLDRLSEGVVFLGILLYAIGTHQNGLLVLTYVSIVGSLLVSYVRARAEGVGIECKVGLFARFERIMFLAICLILRVPAVALWGLAILTMVTVMQRVYHVWRVAEEGR